MQAYTDQGFTDAIQVLQATAAHGAVSAEALAQHVGCSASTARKRALRLAEKGKLRAERWLHIGGAVPGLHEPNPTRHVLAFYAPRKNWPAGVFGDYGPTPDSYLVALRTRMAAGSH